MPKHRKRVKLSGKRSRKLFTKTAKKVHRRNVNVRPMRGGTRA